MHTLSIVIPSYNSQDYLSHCLESILPTDLDVEIIIVDDGSVDATAEIGREYVARYPDTVRLISKPNGGHGSAINAGLAAATGDFFKVLDSDDKLDRRALDSLLKRLRQLTRRSQTVDLVITNFVYDKEGKRKKYVAKFDRILPKGKTFGWDEIRQFGRSQVLLMHALCYRTQVLRDAGLCLPEHTFYVDNLYAFVPLPFVQRMVYVDVNLYHYYIGRDDQSVNETVMLKRVDQQLRVNRLMIEKIPNQADVPEALYRYQVHFLGLVTAVSSILLIRSGTAEHLAEKTALWREIRERDPKAFRLLRRGTVGQLLHLPGKGGRKVTLGVYRAARRVIGFN